MEKEVSIICQKCNEAYGVNKGDFEKEIVEPEEDHDVLHTMLSFSEKKHKEVYFTVCPTCYTKNYTESLSYLLS